jgi:hypothetical protein
MLLLRSRWPNFEHETRIDEMDLAAALNFATNALSNPAQFWIQCSPEQKQRFQRVLFPNGLVFDGESYRTAETCLAFSYLQAISSGDSSLGPKAFRLGTGSPLA